MRKIIDIKEEDLLPLKIMAAKADKDLKNYIQDLITDKVNSKNAFFCDGFLVNGETTCTKQCTGCEKSLYKPKWARSAWWQKK